MSNSNDYQDAGHRPHARHFKGIPRNEIKEAPYHLTVTLDSWGPIDGLFPGIYDALQANWGDTPSRTSERGVPPGEDWPNSLECRSGWSRLYPPERAYVEACFARKTLQQVLERITFSFLVDGCTRACTHQLVRSRIGSAMMQHGGRDNDWRHRPWVMPETIQRACVEYNIVTGDYNEKEVGERMQHCITDWAPITDMIERYENPDADPVDLRSMIADYLRMGRDLYAALVDAGIPWEDARRLLWMGTATYIHIDYNYIAFREMQANRLEHIMDWEINCVAQLMQREVRMKCPPLFSKYLGSHSDLAGKAKFAGLQSWPPDGKYPNPFERCAKCGESKTVCDGIHFDLLKKDPTAPNHVYTPHDALSREHRPEQNPFWVLHPGSMAGGPIVWIPTNGTYPHEAVK